MIQSELIHELKIKWESLDWPGLPPFSSTLNRSACDLMAHDTFVAGCISQIIQNNGKLEKKFWPVLTVDNSLTNRIAATNDTKTQEVLAYKIKLDECIELARQILHRDSKLCD